MALEEEAALSVHQSIIFENLRAQGEDVSEAVASINSKMCESTYKFYIANHSCASTVAVPGVIQECRRCS